MIRFIIAALSIVLFFVFSVILAPIEWIVGKISKQAQDNSRLKIIKAYSRILLFIAGTHVTVIGHENIPNDKSVLYTPNHRGMFDILVMLADAPCMTSFISKKEWKKIPLLSWWIAWLHGLYIDRENIREALKTVLSAVDLVKDGISVVIFPEGTRGRVPDERQMNPFHEGSLKIAAKSGCPIIPVAITHTSEIFEDQFPKLRSKKVILEYGKPVYPEELSKEDRKFIGRYVQGIVQEMLDRNHEIGG